MVQRPVPAAASQVVKRVITVAASERRRNIAGQRLNNFGAANVIVRILARHVMKGHLTWLAHLIIQIN